MVLTDKTSRWYLAAASGSAAFYAGILFCLLPPMPIVMNDDFGYLKSVIETLQHHRPWTDDWLEPWAYSFSAIAALLFRLTGAFGDSIKGLLIVLGVVDVCLVGLLLKRRGVSPLLSVIWTLLIVGFPTIAWKHVEFTAMALYMPCLLGALLFADRKQWAGFFVCWALAVASRQSAGVWFVIPAWEVFACYRAQRWEPLRRALFMLAFACVGLGVLVLTANPTHARVVVTSKLLSNVTFHSIQSFGVGLLYIISAMGLGSLIGGICTSSEKTRIEIRTPDGIFRVAASLALATAAVWPRVMAVEVETSAFDGEGMAWMLRGLLLCAATGFIIFPWKYRGDYCIAALGSVALVSLRSTIYDYYLTDAVLLALASPIIWASPASECRTASFTKQEGVKLAVLCATFALLARCDMGALARMKEFVDYRAASCGLYERALRAGVIQPTEIAEAPFGLLGWYFFPYYIQHEGKNRGELDGFGAYLASGALSVLVNPPPQSIGGSDTKFLATERHPFGWRRTATFVLVSHAHPTPPSLPLNSAEYHPSPFPLTNEEWAVLAKPKDETARLPNLP